jgi:hypothetical protein
MAFQDIVKPQGEPKKLLTLKGSDIIGTKIKAPFSISPEVYVLPMEGVLPSKVSSPPYRHLTSYVNTLIGYWRRHICTLRLSG